MSGWHPARELLRPPVLPPFLRIIAPLVLSACAGFAQSEPDAIPLPDGISVGDKTYAVVSRAEIPNELRTALPNVWRFSSRQPLDLLDASLRYWLEGSEFLKSPDGKFALPFRGSAPFVGFIEIAKKEFVRYDAHFPPTGEEPAKGGPPRYEWAALPDDERNAPTGLWLFVRRWDRELQVMSSHRARVSFADPARIQVEPMKAAVERVYARDGKEMLCLIVEAGGETWARISTDTWEILAKGKPLGEHGHIGPVKYSPDRSEIYAVYSSGGLIIFDAADGREKIHPGKCGRFANAFTLGATFDPSGSVALVSTPYASEITLIEVKTGRVVARYKTSAPLAGVVFDDKERKAYTFRTFLPYE